MSRKIPDGATVKIFHYRRYQHVHGLLTRGEAQRLGVPGSPLPRGGVTHVVIFDADEKPLVLGEATCADLDNYSRSKGRLIALGRALKALEVNSSCALS